MKTDLEIQKDVLDELKWEPFLSASEIGVTFKNGIVTLSGSVDSYIKKQVLKKQQNVFLAFKLLLKILL